MTTHQRPSALTILRVWLGLGLQSFGGGAATLYLIRRATVEHHRWLDEAEFSRDWAICQIGPGINLLGLTILIGRRVGGIPGALLALCGLLLPSVSVTILLTALYAAARRLDPMEAALQSLIPATAGLGLLLAYQTARPLVLQACFEGPLSHLVAWMLLLGSAMVYWLWRPPVFAMLFGAGLIGALIAFVLQRPQRAPQPAPAKPDTNRPPVETTEQE